MTVKFIIVGAGAIAGAYETALRNCEHSVLAGIVDIDEALAAEMAARNGCSGCASVETALEQLDFDAAVVCTPPNKHCALTCTLLAREKHVLCEKPLATTESDARQMADIALNNGCLLTMGSKFRYVEDVVRAKKIVDSGILGEIVLFENAFTGWTDMRSRWNSRADISGGGVLIDNGTHSLDIMRYLIGSIAEVKVIEGKRLQSEHVEDTVRVFARTDDGVMGSVDLSWSINKELNSYIDIYGSMGTVKVGWKESKYRQSNTDEWIRFGSGYDKVQAFTSQINNLCAAIEDRESLLITPQDAIASVKVIEAAYTAMNISDWVRIDPKEISAEAGTKA